MKKHISHVHHCFLISGFKLNCTVMLICHVNVKMLKVLKYICIAQMHIFPPCEFHFRSLVN